MEQTKQSSSGTDDDLPTQDINRNPRVVQQSRAMRITSERETDELEFVDMEFQIHCIETAAYGAVLKAFIAQSDVLTWGKEGLMTDLRQELRVSDVEHREILAKINMDDSIKMIRECRKGAVFQNGQLPNMVNAPGYAQISMGHDSHKRLKTSHRSLSSSPKYLTHVQPSSAAIPSSLVGQVRDNQWETNAVMISPQVNIGQAIKSVPQNKLTSSLGKGRGSMIVQSSRKGTNMLRPGSDTIEIWATEKLMQEVERLCGGENPDPVQVEKAKQILREHEKNLVEAIAKLAYLSDDDEFVDPRQHRSFL